VFSSASSDSYDSDGGEVLPLAPTSHNNASTGGGSHPPLQNSLTPSMGTGDDGKWFQTLDERYFLPIFSNATASRTFHARRARRSASGLAAGGSAHGSSMGTPADSEDEVDLSAQDVEMGRQGGGVNVRNINISGSSGGGLGIPSTRSMSVDDSRVERGLASPVLRSSGQGDTSRFS